MSAVAPAISTSPLTAGTQVGAYTVLRPIGTGGMAAVYLVRRTASVGFSKLMAMKVILPHLAAEPKFVRMFLDEIRLASRLQHRNTVFIVDAGQHEGRPWMVMELLRGVPLSQLLRCGVPPLAVALSVLEQAARGLHAAHMVRGADGSLLQLVHRDISPQNLHVGYDGTIKLMDFGIATAVGRLTTTNTGELKGKFSYLAPEQIHGEASVDRRTDIFAFGVVAWESFAGKSLFTGKNQATTLWNVLHADIADLKEIRSDLPDAVSTIVRQCLERDPHRRPQSAQDVADILETVSQQLASSPTKVAQYVETHFGAARITEEQALLPFAREAEVAEWAPEVPTLPTPGEPSAIAGSAGPAKRLWWVGGLGLIVGAAVAVGFALAIVPSGDGREQSPPQPAPILNPNQERPLEEATVVIPPPLEADDATPASPPSESTSEEGGRPRPPATIRPGRRRPPRRQPPDPSSAQSPTSPPSALTPPDYP